MSHAMSPVKMEEHFCPGITRPAVHVGSQTMRFFCGNPKEQAWEALLLAAAFDQDITVVRDVDPDYLAYWASLTGGYRVVNASGANPGEYLSRVLLDDPVLLEIVRLAMAPGARLHVFFPTPLEQELADALGIPLHGSPEVSARYGTKSGVRDLARAAGIPMPPGCVCRTYAEVEEAVTELRDQFDELVIKHDLSTGGDWSQRFNVWSDDPRAVAAEVSDGHFVEGRDVVVVEGWLQTIASLCAHIEIPPEGNPVVCAGWQQVLGEDGKTHIGSGPLMLSAARVAEFHAQAHRLAVALQREGAVGSFGPDFLVVDQAGTDDGEVVLVELNARIPATAFPLQIVRQVKGAIGTGFCSRHVHLARPASFSEVAGVLQAEGLLITELDPNASGVVPYNVGLLPWQLFDVVAIADDWEEALRIIGRVDNAINNLSPRVSRPDPQA